MLDIMRISTVFLFILTQIHRGAFSLTLDGEWSGIIKYCGNITTNDCENEILFPATVPGGIYTDLGKLNMIPNNFIGSNDVNNRWVGNQSVTYVKDFNADNSWLRVPKVVIIFHGLDTFATVFLNDQEIGKASNMFLRYIFDVTKYIKEGKNTLKVSFSSATKVAENLYNEQAKTYIIPPVCVPKTYNGVCHVNHIRKMQASFAWDWGPAFPSMGIWKHTELVPVQEVLITDVTTDVSKVGNLWNIVVTTFFEIASQGDKKDIFCNITSALYVDEHSKIQNSTNNVLQTNKAYASVTTTVTVPAERVRMWWPNGYGDQSLYKLILTVTTPQSRIHKELRVGFRTVELVQEPLKKGRTFYFRINDIPIFAKGSNFIPASIFPELGAEEDTIKHLLTSAKETHMNMLRVWGGGLYESDLFYNLADEYGIMIWQDFMFACGMYPTKEEFLKSVREEVIHNVKRLKNHPSIVIWAGNNENEAALYGDWYQTGTARIYRTDYVKLYVNVIKNEVEKLDTTRPFVVSSPSNGLYTEEYNYTGQDPYSNFYGDVHWYNYFDNGWDMHHYPRARFSSEYGFQSLPSIYTIASVTETVDDYHINSDFMQHRQHLPLGNTYLTSLISKNFLIPSTNNAVRDFIDLIYLSQINQAVSTKTETEFYRQMMSEINEFGEGLTMGALYWQLNDVWQAPSWSSIDIDGRWKMLHYYTAEFFAPIIVTYYIQPTDLSIFIVSDKLHPVSSTMLEINLYNWNEMRPVHSYTCNNITIEASKANKMDGCRQKYESETILKHGGITTLTLKDKDGFQIAPTNYIYPTTQPLKKINLPVADISVKINSNTLPGKYSNYPDFELELVTNNIALFVWLEAGNIRGRFSENGFHMFESTKRVVFHAREMIAPQIFKQFLNVTTLSDIYNVNRIRGTNCIVVE